MRFALIGAALLLFPPQSTIEITAQQSGTTARLIAVSAVSPTVVWASGERGTYARTTDGGATWKAAQVPGAERLDFRDVHAMSETTALLMSAGTGAMSRVYRTTDAGASWQLVFTNPDSAGFYDCIDFFDERRGLMLGDEMGGKMAMYATKDGGITWFRVPPSSLPPALDGEGSFASSGTCLVARASGHAWGVTTKGRVIRTSDYGRTWSVSVAMTTTSDSVGLASVTFRNARHGFVFGGYGARPADTLVYETNDGGATWSAHPRPPNGAGVWGGAFVPGASATTIVTVGPRGASYSHDGGRRWVQIDSVNYWGLGFAPAGNVGWLVGRGGRVARVRGF